MSFDRYMKTQKAIDFIRELGLADMEEVIALLEAKRDSFRPASIAPDIEGEACESCQ